MKNYLSELKNNKSRVYETGLMVAALYFIAHGFCMFNEFFSHDSLQVYLNDTEHQLSIGRFLNPLYLTARGRLSPPFIIGILSIVFITVAALLLFKLFKIERKESRLAICGILSINFVVSLLNATYVNFTDIFMCSMMFATMGVFFIRADSSWKNFVAAALMFVISAGLYQSYLQYATAILMMLSMIDLLEGRSDAVRQGVREVGALAAGVAGYYLVYKVSLAATRITASNDYNAVERASFSFKELPAAIAGAYGKVFTYYSNPVTFHKKLVAVITLVLIIWCIAAMLRLARQNRITLERLAMAAILLFLLPLGMNFIHIISNGSEHALMMYSILTIYILAVALVERSQINREKIAVLFMVGVMLVCGVFSSNQMYLQKELNAKSSLSLATRIVTRIENMDGYDRKTTKVVIVCDPYKINWVLQAKTGFDYETIGINFASSFTYYETYAWYFEYMLGFEPLIVDEDEALQFIADHQEQIDAIKAWPSKEAIQFVDGVLVVKMQ